MSLSFILIGVLNILFVFGVISYSKKSTKILTVIALTFSMVGEFYGTVELSYFSFNIFYLISIFVFIFLNLRREDFSYFYIVLILSICTAFVLYLDLNFLSVFSFALYYMMVVIMFLFLYSQPRQLFVSILLFSIFYFLIDGYFQFVEMGFAIVDFSRIVIPVILLCGISCAYFYSGGINIDRVYCEKN